MLGDLPRGLNEAKSSVLVMMQASRPMLTRGTCLECLSVFVVREELDCVFKCW